MVSGTPLGLGLARRHPLIVMSAGGLTAGLAGGCCGFAVSAAASPMIAVVVVKTLCFDGLMMAPVCGCTVPSRARTTPARYGHPVDTEDGGAVDCGAFRCQRG